MLSNLTLYYWNFRGLGGPMATMLEYLKVPYNYIHFEEREDWKKEKNRLIESGFKTPNLPYIHDKSSGVQISESIAILHYLAAKYDKNLIPETREEMTQVLMVQGIILDYEYKVTMPAYDCSSVDEMIKQLHSNMEIYKSKNLFWKYRLEQQKWIMGDQLSFLDFFFAELIEKLITMQEELKEDFVDKLTYKAFRAYVDRFAELEGVKEFRASSRFIKRPYNHPPVALWG